MGARRVFRLLYLCDPLVVVAFFFLNRSSHQGKGQGGSNRKRGWNGRRVLGWGKDLQLPSRLTPGERASCRFNILGKPRGSARWTDRRTDGQFRDWADLG